MKIAIAIPHTGSIKMHTMLSIVKMLKNMPCDWQLIGKEGSIVHWNRESLAKKALELECTHLLFIDTDMVFEPDALLSLIKRDKDIVGVPYNLRKDPPITTMKIHGKNGEIIQEEVEGGLVKCAGLGTGFLLIKTDVFKKLSHPWFFWESDEEGEVKMGEDMWFCFKAQEAGYEVFADLTVRVGHIGEKIY